MRPGEILDARAELIDRFKENRGFKQQAIWSATASLSGRPGPLAHQSLAPGENFIAAVQHWLNAAYCYRVTHDMSMVVQHAADSLDESDTFNRHLAPTGCGFVRFDKPIKIQDVRGDEMWIHFAVWGPAQVGDGNGLAFTFYNDLWTAPDPNYTAYIGNMAAPEKQMYVDTLGRWGGVAQTFARHGVTMGPTMTAGSPEQQAWIIASGSIPHAATNLTRIMHALFLLLNQTITVTEDEQVERAARRRAEKRNLPPKVTVIKLRRTEGANRREDESLIEWSHRWIVRGHWAWRRCGAEHPMAEEYPKGWRVRVWIAPYQKGPEDAPLVVSDKLYSLDR